MKTCKLKSKTRVNRVQNGLNDLNPDFTVDAAVSAIAAPKSD
jgi:hypothetical protein